MDEQPYHLIWTTQATGEIHMNQQIYTLKPFRLFLLQPGTDWHTVIAEKEYEQFPIHIDLFRRFQNQHIQDSRLDIFQPNCTGPYLDLEPSELLPVSVVYQLAKTFPPPAPFPRFFQNLAFALLIHIADCYRSRHPSVHEEPPALTQLKGLIDQHCREQRSCRFYAKAMGTSAKKLNVLTRITTGKVVEQLVMERLYQAAEELLSSSDLSIKHIAYELGFADQAHFNRFFHKYGEQSPMAFRLERISHKP